jgi:hypothetical protein
MGLRQLHTYLFECDGFTVEGKKCRRDVTQIAWTTFEAEQRVRAQGWDQGSRGWLCDIPHRGDQKKEE